MTNKQLLDALLELSPEQLDCEAAFYNTISKKVFTLDECCLSDELLPTHLEIVEDKLKLNHPKTTCPDGGVPVLIIQAIR